MQRNLRARLQRPFERAVAALEQTQSSGNHGLVCDMCIELAKIAASQDKPHLVAPLLVKAKSSLARASSSSSSRRAAAAAAAAGDGSRHIARATVLAELEKQHESRVAVDALPLDWDGGNGVR